MAKKLKLPSEILNIIEEVKEKLKKEDTLEARQYVEEVRSRREQSKDYWDYKIGDEIPFFDRNLSYELTGYRPINATLGLDFDPSWFTTTRDNYHKNNESYCSYLPGSKRYREFWKEQYRRCRDGLTVNGYTITGDHYFFLNFYLLPITSSATKAGGGRKSDFPSFFVSQYEFFHYFELAKRLRKHVGLMKARGIG